MRATSLELRHLIVDANERGEGTQGEIAQRFRCGIATVVRLVSQWRETHDLSVTYIRSGPVALVPAEDLPELVEFVADGRSDWTADQIKEAWGARKGIALSRSAMVRALKKAGLSTKKKTFVASEQERPDVVEKREAFRKFILSLDFSNCRPIFIDETGVNLAMSPLYARAPVGDRAVCRRPAARGSNISIVGALDAAGIVAFDARDGAYDGERFIMFLECKLIPKLRDGDIVFMDNVRFHKVDGIREKIEATGAKLHYLPPYSPEMNPIEEVWSFFKNLMRRASARNLSNLVDALVTAMVAVTRELAGAFFTHAGYAQFT